MIRLVGVNFRLAYVFCSYLNFDVRTIEICSMYEKRGISLKMREGGSYKQYGMRKRSVQEIWWIRKYGMLSLLAGGQLV